MACEGKIHTRNTRQEFREEMVPHSRAYLLILGICAFGFACSTPAFFRTDSLDGKKTRCVFADICRIDGHSRERRRDLRLDAVKYSRESESVEAGRYSKVAKSV